MSQTSFLLSGVSNNNAALGEGKGVLSPEVTESEGEGFFAQLAQLVSGEGEATPELASDAALTEGDAASEEAISDALLKSMTAVDGDGAENLALEGDIPDAENASASEGKSSLGSSTSSEDAALALNVKSAESDKPALQQLAKQDGEALLQRLNESSQALQNDTKVSVDGAEVTLAKPEKLTEGKRLPSESDPNLAVDPALLSKQAAVLANSDNLSDEQQAALLAQQDKRFQSEQPVMTKAMLSDAEKSAVTDKALTENGVSVAILDDQQAVMAAGLGAMSESAETTDPALLAAAGVDTLSDAERAALLSESVKQVQSPLMQTQIVGTATQVVEAGIDGEITPEMLAKAGVAFESLPKSQQDAMLRAQALAAQSGQGSPLAGDGEPSALMNELTARGLTTQAQANMTQTATAVHAAVNPSAAQATAMSAFAAIPWTPAAMQSDIQPQLNASSAALEAASAQSLSDATRPGTDVKTEQLAQQLASSFGNQSSTTAARLDTTVAQSPLQMSQNQADAANALSERVNVMLSKNLKHVDIRLDPPELGRMQIKLSMNQDQASVQFTVANQAARELVEQSMPRLREMMQQQGLQLSQSSVQQQDTGGRQAFAGSQSQQGNGQGGEGGQSDASGFGRGESEQELDRSSINHELYVNSSKDRVDYYA
ncbi:flagellar hook-length control protein FliK [Enterovibrio sp. 27052020O]|uniref:flagellar hook-length control protein FliK n=1 Tax=Enterovibrio sp. 27052020O TaxID=3241166 RepID=UPI00388F27B3